MPLRLVDTRTHIVAVENGRVTGTIGVLSQPGRVGLVFPPELDRCSSEVPGALIDAALRRLEQAGAAFAQLTLPLAEASLADPFLMQGFSLLTDAVVLERAAGAVGDGDRGSLRAIPCDPEDDASRVADLISRINQGTLDCPELDLLRTPEDLAQAHRSHSEGGRARWWRYEDAGNDVGIVLGTTADDSEALEILFFGVIPEQRGKGFGRKLLDRFLADAGGGRTLSRAGMDARNAFAARVYGLCGFRETGRMKVWVHPLAAPV
jgi:ribosomal protein S18 acetylase RimI-like enzyme